MVENREARALVEDLGDLPALPTVVTEVLRLTENPETATAEVSRAVQKDPALAAKVLRVSNSSYYGMKQYVGTLKLALVILGAREVRNIVLGIAVFDALSGSDDQARTVQRIWNRSLVIGGLNKMLATEMRLGFQGEEFIAGLLADIGKMALLHLRGAEYTAMHETMQQNVNALMIKEREQYGMTHAEVAAALAMRWNLPQTLTDALWHQYAITGRPLKEARDPRLAAVQRIARRAMMDDFDGGGTPVCLRDTEAWAELEKSPHPIPEDVRRPLIAGFIKELSDMPKLPF